MLDLQEGLAWCAGVPFVSITSALRIGTNNENRRSV